MSAVQSAMDLTHADATEQSIVTSQQQHDQQQHRSSPHAEYVTSELEGAHVQQAPGAAAADNEGGDVTPGLGMESDEGVSIALNVLQRAINK